MDHWLVKIMGLIDLAKWNIKVRIVEVIKQLLGDEKARS